MSLSDDLNSQQLASERVPAFFDSTFDSTLKSFDVTALNLKRGLQVNLALNSLRTLGQLNRELKSRTSGAYDAISYQPVLRDE